MGINQRNTFDSSRICRKNARKVTDIIAIPIACPFCQTPFTITNTEGGYFSTCHHISCKKFGNRITPRWNMQVQSNQLLYYQARIEFNNKIYIIQGSSWGPWTRLYIDDSFKTIPLYSINYMLPLTQPYLDCLNKNIKKLFTYAVFS